MKTIIIAILMLSIFECFSCYAFKTWGDVANRPVVSTTRAKEGLFLWKKSIDFEYPKVSANIFVFPFRIFYNLFFQDFSAVQTKKTVVRGIQLYNLSHDSECLPSAEIVQGALDEGNVTVRATAPRGCGVKAYVQIYYDEI